MKKLLVISYFFPPSAKAGAHRAYSIAQYCPQYGWEPAFLAPENGYFGRISRYDNKLLQLTEQFSTYRISSYYPFNNQNMSILARGARRYWDQMWLPDGKRLWNFFIKKQLDQIIQNERPDVVFVSGTPFSSFLLAPYIKKEFKLPVVLDYRDPWLGNIELKRAQLIQKIHFRLEKKAVESAKLLTTASYHMIDYITQTSGDYMKSRKFFGFPYGFDNKYSDRTVKNCISNKRNLRGVFAGFVHGDIDIHEILKGVGRFAKCSSISLEISCYGTLFGHVNKPEKFLSSYGLERVIKLFPFQSYEAFMQILSDADFLILPHGESRLTSVLYPTKFFDYLAVKRPILYWGNRGNVWESIETIGAGICALPTTEEICESFNRLHGRSNYYEDEAQYLKFSRAQIFKEFCKQLDILVTS